MSADFLVFAAVKAIESDLKGLVENYGEEKRHRRQIQEEHPDLFDEEELNDRKTQSIQQLMNSLHLTTSKSRGTLINDGPR